MDTRGIAREYRITQWQQIITERREKGLTIRAYCRNKGIQESTYHYWQKKLREVLAAKAEAVIQDGTLTCMEPRGWLAVRTEPDANASIGVYVEVNGCWISVDKDTDERLLQKVCRALKAV